MVIGSYISIITFNVNGLNEPSKGHRLAGWRKTCEGMHFHLPLNYYSFYYCCIMIDQQKITELSYH